LNYFKGTQNQRFLYKKQVLLNAIEKKDKGYTPIEHVPITMFWDEYYQF
jgi:hypothetical protein